MCGPSKNKWRAGTTSNSPVAVLTVVDTITLALLTMADKTDQTKDADSIVIADLLVCNVCDDQLKTHIKS